MKEYLTILQSYGVDIEHRDVLDIKIMLQDQGVYLAPFIWFYAAGEIPVLELQQLYFKIKTYRELLRQYKITPLDVYKPKYFDAKKQYELLLDVIDEAISENQKENFSRSFISKKYLHLINRNSMQVLWKLHDELKLDRKKIQNLIFDKLAVYKYDNEFEKAIVKTFNMLTQGTWNVEYVKMELMQELIDVVFYNDNLLIARLDTYEQCKTIGPRSWCIARSKSMFDSYTKNGTQYIIYNTSKDRTNGDAIVGFTAKLNRQNLSQNSFMFYGVSYNQFDKPYDWKKNLQKYMIHMPCIKEIDFMPENLKEKIYSTLSKNSAIDDFLIQELDEDNLTSFKKLASYQKNALLYGAILLNKENSIVELLKDKNINVNSNAIWNLSLNPNNMLAAAIKVKNETTIKQVLKHRSCNQETINSCYYEMLKSKNHDTPSFRILKDQYVKESQIESMIFHLSKYFMYWSWRLTDNEGISNTLNKFLNIHKPSQSLIINYLNKVRDNFFYNDFLLLFQKAGYGKNLPLKHRKTLRK